MIIRLIKHCIGLQNWSHWHLLLRDMWKFVMVVRLNVWGLFNYISLILVIITSRLWNIKTIMVLHFKHFPQCFVILRTGSQIIKTLKHGVMKLPCGVMKTLSLIFFIHFFENWYWLWGFILRIKFFWWWLFHHVFTTYLFRQRLLKLLILICFRKISLFEQTLLQMRWHRLRFNWSWFLYDVIIFIFRVRVLIKWTVLMSIFIKNCIINSGFSLSLWSALLTWKIILDLFLCICKLWSINFNSVINDILGLGWWNVYRI